MDESREELIARKKKEARERVHRAKLKAKKLLLARKKVMGKKKKDFVLQPGQPRFKVCVWKWAHTIDNCAICRNELMDLCIECQANSTSHIAEECHIAFGTCGHPFHFHCISRWLKNRNVCPLDSTEWELERVGKNNY